MKAIQWSAVWELVIEGILILLGLSVLLFLGMWMKGVYPLDVCMTRALTAFLASPVILILALGLMTE